MFFGTFCSVLSISISGDSFQNINRGGLVDGQEKVHDLRQHFGLLVQNMPTSNNAAIATIVESGGGDTSSDIMLVPGGHLRPMRTYLFIALFMAKSLQILVC